MKAKNKSNLPVLMKKKNLRNEDLMKLAGLSKQTVIRLRRDQIFDARFKTLRKVADALDCSIDDLFSS